MGGYPWCSSRSARLLFASEQRSRAVRILEQWGLFFSARLSIVHVTYTCHSADRPQNAADAFPGPGGGEHLGLAYARNGRFAKEEEKAVQIFQCIAE
jgi:hypothetical protein